MYDGAVSDRLVLVGAGIVFAVAGMLGVVRYAGASPAERGAERVLASLALAAVLAVPGVLALVGRAGRPSLLVAAGALLLLLTPLAFSGVTLPLIVPGVLLLSAGLRATPTASRPRVPAVVTALAVLSLCVAAVAALLVHQDPRTWSTATESGGTSDVVTGVESCVALGLAALAVAAGAWLSAPRVPRRSRPAR
jgi:hypothetical protein